MNQLQNNNNKQQKSRNTPVLQAGVFLLYQNEVSNMGFFSWLGFGKPRDATKRVKTVRQSLPEITDNVHDSWQILLWHDKLWGAGG